MNEKLNKDVPSDEPILSIIIPTYNHEKYISEALDSVLMQKTKYSFEVLVGEDCSTDNTKKIIKEYELSHPGFFNVFYRDHNMHLETVSNVKDLLLRCKGKYIIVLEGDDFWTDPQKIEKQISFLESHGEYYAVAHNCIVVGDDSKPNGEQYPECKEPEYTYRHYFSGIYPGQNCTVMYRNYFHDIKFNDNFPELPKGIPGDRAKYYKLLVNGEIYCIQEIMSAYRHITTGGTSFSSTYKYVFEKDVIWYKSLLEYTKKNKKEWIKYAKALYLDSLFFALKRKKCSIKEMMRYISRDRLWDATYQYSLYVFRKRIIKSKFLV